MAWALRVCADICWIPEGTGGVSIRSIGGMGNEPGLGSTLASGAMENAQTLRFQQGEAVVGFLGSPPSAAAIENALAAAAADLGAQMTTPANLEEIQNWQMGQSAPPITNITTIATLTLVNAGVSNQSAGVPTPVFGWCFKDGDIQPGTAPIFTAAGVVQPFSAGLQTYWPSGCLKYAAFMLRPTFAVSTSASQAVSISNGGAWPASSGRSLAEVYNQNLIINAPLYNSAQNGRGGTLTLKSWLNGDVNQFKAVKWLDGAAGTGWRISTHMASVQGGTIDGMLACDHYVIALNNSAGGLGGFRWLGAIRQPFYNQSGQANNAPGVYVFFATPSVSSPSSGLNWSINPSGTTTYTPLAWLGNDGNTFDTVNFTCPGGGTATLTVAASGTDNWYMGAGGSQFIPLALSSLSANQTGLSQGGTGLGVASGGFAFAYTDGNNPSTQFELFYSGQQNFSNQFSYSGASFTGTATPCPVSTPFGRLFFATKDAAYNFFQGSGSLTADTQLIAQIDQAYWQGSGVIQPFNLSVQGSALGGIITEQTFTDAWYPYSVGSMTVQEPGTGDHNDIGILPGFASNDFYNQTAGTLRHNRIIGLSCAASVIDFIDGAAKTRVNLGNPSGAGGGGGYGLAAPPDSRINLNYSFLYNGGYFSNPNTTALNYALSIGEHEPAWPVWAYLRTGELQFLDLIVDQHVMSQLTIGGNRTLNSGNYGVSTTLYGSNFGSNEMRSLAWSMRDAQWAAHLYPRDPTANANNPLYSDGTNLTQYLWDSAETCVTWPLLQIQAPQATIPWSTWAQNNGFWFPWFNFSNNSLGTASWGVSGGQWQLADFIQSMCLAVARGSSNAKSFILACPALEWAHDLSVLGGWLYICDSNRFAYLTTDNTGQYTNALITDDTHYGETPFSLFANITAGHNYITWAPNSSTPAFTMTTGYGSGSLFGWTPANGDIYIPTGYAFGNPNDLWPSALSPGVPYYAVNVAKSGSNWIFDLAATLNGTAISITDTSGSGVSFGFKLQPVNKPATGTVYTDIYLGNFWFATCWANALGITNFGTVANNTTVIGDIHNRMAHSSAGAGGIDVTGYFLDQLSPAVYDTRYCMQPIFA